MKRPWLALDQHFVDDERIVDLGDAHGAGAVTAYIALLCTAKQSGTAGTVEVGYRALARKAFLEGGAEQAERIVAAATELGLLESRPAGESRVEVTFPRWERYQRDPFRAHRNTTSTAPQRDCGPTETETTTKTKTKQTTSSAKAADAPLSNLLADLIAQNGSRRPRIGTRWLDAERLLLERDERDRSEAERLIRWCQADEFWRGNILSMPKFRQKYDQLRLQAQRHNGSTPDPAREAEARRKLLEGTG